MSRDHVQWWVVLPTEVPVPAGSGHRKTIGRYRTQSCFEPSGERNYESSCIASGYLGLSLRYGPVRYGSHLGPMTPIDAR